MALESQRMAQHCFQCYRPTTVILTLSVTTIHHTTTGRYARVKL